MEDFIKLKIGVMHLTYKTHQAGLIAQACHPSFARLKQIIKFKACLSWSKLMASVTSKCKTLSPHTTFFKTGWRAGATAQLVDHLPGMHKALSPIRSIEARHGCVDL